jgi:NAD(P)-dependent dehydrogenase (short-subunit alcohol dehydrogenase family)
MAGRLEDRGVLITGASRGIGRAVAVRFAAEGAHLFLTATNEALLGETGALAEEAGARVTLHLADVRDRDAVGAMVEAAATALGGVDVLVNNAGVYKAARFVDYTPEDFDRVMQVNLYGAFHVMQLGLRHMLERPSDRGGRRRKIINLGSTAGKWASANQSAYNASKHALVGLTRCAALENGALGVNINAICPGLVETDMLQQFETHAEILGIPLEQVLEGGKSRIAIGRFIRPDEVADLALYLASAESDGMTGQSILLDGGMLFV